MKMEGGLLLLGPLCRYTVWQSAEFLLLCYWALKR